MEGLLTLPRCAALLALAASMVAAPLSGQREELERRQPVRVLAELRLLAVDLDVPGVTLPLVERLGVVRHNKPS